MPEKIVSLSDPAKIHSRWQPLLSELIASARVYWGEKLLAVYLLGSIGRGQEQIGSSDLDLELVISHKATDADKAWADALSEQTLLAWPDLLKIDLDLLPIDVLQAPESQRLRFIFASDGLQLWGQELLPPAEAWVPGPELAYLLNSHYAWARDEILRCLKAPTAEEQANPRHLAECLHWISKQALRLGLGLAMCQKPVYTRTVAEMPELAGQVLPEIKNLLEQIYTMYRNPLNETASALAFMQSLEPLYHLADQRWQSV
jgi:hypothetical protein